jgi:hypothetical protein
VRIESSVLSISWIPSEAVAAATSKLPFEMGIAHYDPPPPDVVTPADLEDLRQQDRFRFSNLLSAWIDVEHGRIVDHGRTETESPIGSTTLRLGSKKTTFQAIALPTLRPDPEVRSDHVTFTQTTGGRTGVPAPRTVRRAPFVQYRAPLAWSTVELTLHADGRVERGLVGASPFPRHWVYDDTGKLCAKSGLIDFKWWYRRAFGKQSPWGAQDSPALTSVIETALERELSVSVMQGGEKPAIRDVKAGTALTTQGEPGNDLFLILDGVVRVEVGGERIAEYGPGSFHGERAVLEGGLRTSTLRAVTSCKVAVVSADQVQRDALVELSAGHRREDERPT